MEMKCKPRLSVEIDLKLREKFRAYAMLDGSSMTDLVVKWIEEYVQRKENNA